MNDFVSATTGEECLHTSANSFAHVRTANVENLRLAVHLELCSPFPVPSDHLIEWELIYMVRFL